MIHVIVASPSPADALIGHILDRLDEPWCTHVVSLAHGRERPCDQRAADALERLALDDDVWRHGTWALVAPEDSSLAICLLVEIYGRSGRLPHLIDPQQHCDGMLVDLAQQRAIARCRRIR